MTDTLRPMIRMRRVDFVRLIGKGPLPLLSATVGPRRSETCFACVESGDGRPIRYHPSSIDAYRRFSQHVTRHLAWNGRGR